MQDDEIDDRPYVVVVNHEEQYSIWFAERTVPTGWTVVGEPASKNSCLDYIESVWTDITPKSVRERLAHRNASVK